MRNIVPLLSRTVFIVLVLLTPNAPFRAQQPQQSSRQLQLEPVQTWPMKAKRWAVVIGVDKYADTQITTLGGSANDAKTLADALIKYAGFPSDQVFLLASDQPAERQPTRGNILRRLSNLAASVPRDGLLLVSFAGHGMERANQAFLLPSDAQVSNDVDLLELTAINVTQMKEFIRRTGVGQVVLILDACRNDPVGRANADNPLTSAYVRGFNFDVRNKEVTAFATLYATAVGQRAYEYREKKQGYFTWELVEGLKGGAANERGEVTLAGLLRYVQDNVPKHVLADLGAGKDQKPFAEIGGYRADQLVISVVQQASGQPTRPTGAADLPGITRVDPAAFEITYWDTIKNSTDPEDFRSYLQKYPEGQFADLAQRRVNSFSGVKSDPGAATSSSGTTGASRPQPSNPTTQSQSAFVLSDILVLGINIGLAEVASYQNVPNQTIQNYLGVAQTLAARNGIGTQSIDNVLVQLRNGAATAGQYQSLVAARQGFHNVLSRTCNCPAPMVLANIFDLGYQIGFIEIIAYQNGDHNQVSQILTTAIQYAAANGLPTPDFDDLLRKVQSGKRGMEVYNRLIEIQTKIVQSLNRNCAC